MGSSNFSTDNMPRVSWLPALPKNRQTLLVLLPIFIVAYVVLVSVYYQKTEVYAIAEAEKAALDTLLTHKAIHRYVTEVSRPEIYRLQNEGLLYKEYFSPKVMSFTFTARSIMGLINDEREKVGLLRMYFKLATDNPRNPVNQADAFESAILERMNRGEVNEVRQVVDQDGEATLHLAVPIDRSSRGCMKCHGDPEDAPAELVALYGNQRGFHEDPDKIRALISIRVPLSQTIGAANEVARILAIVSFSVMAAIYALVYFFILRIDREQQAVNASINERKRAEDRLRESRDRLEAAASAGIVGVWDWDVPNHRFVWDKVMHRLYGLDEDAPIENAYATWVNALHPDDRANVESQVQAALRGEAAYAPEFRVILPDGTIRHIKAQGQVTFDESGRPLLMLGVNFDITDQKNIEKMLEEGIAKRTHELKLARDAAQAASVAKTAFLANMSHELRTPLHQIAGMAQLVTRQPLTTEQMERMGKLNAAALRMTDIVDTILELAKIESEQFELVEAPFNLDDLLSDVMSFAQTQASSKPLQLECKSAGVPVRLLGDRRLVQKALLNYVSNAIRFTEAGGITIRLSKEAEVGDNVLIRFEVEDTGLGIDPQDLPRLFSIFEQVDNSTTRKYGGLGAGLATTRKIANNMGGDAGCTSVPGVGSSFWFTAQLKKA